MRESRARRILLTADTVGGVWTYAVTLAAGLREMGAQVTLATMGSHPSPEQVAAVAQLDGVRLFESTYALEWMKDPWTDVDAAGAWLLGLEQTVRPDIVQLCSYSHASLPFEAPTVVVCHSCVCTWWKAVKRCEAPAEWNEYRRRVAGGLRHADQVVAPTRAILDEVCRAYDVPRRGVVIPNGIDLSVSRRATKEPLILGAGRLWDEAKNLAELDAIGNSLEWPLYLAGSDRSPGGHTVHLKQAHWLGNLAPSAMASWMARAAIYVMPARYEPFGLSVLEAAASGCALVLGDIPCSREVWQDAALYVDPYDTSAWASVINQLSRDPERLSEMARRSTERANQFGKDTMTTRYQRLYDELMERKPTLPTETT